MGQEGTKGEKWVQEGQKEVKWGQEGQKEVKWGQVELGWIRSSRPSGQCGEMFGV